MGSLIQFVAVCPIVQKFSGSLLVSFIYVFCMIGIIGGNFNTGGGGDSGLMILLY